MDLVMDVNEFAMPLSEKVKSTKFVLLETLPSFKYVDGVPTKEIIATRYIVADSVSYKSYEVKVPNPKPILSQDAIDNATTPVYVEFEQALIIPYDVKFKKAYSKVYAQGIRVAKE